MTNSAIIQWHNELKALSAYVYDIQKNKLPEGYKILFDDYNPNSGFYGCVVKKGNDVVIVYRGTELKDIKDFSNDKQLLDKKNPNQAKDAMYLYNLAEQYCSNNNLFLTLTGHSLGGSLAEIVGAKTGTATVTFNAYGVRDVLKESEIKYENNITNYCSKTDYTITRINADKHVGKCYVVPSSNSVFSHFIGFMGDLSQAQEIDPKYLDTGRVIKSRIEQEKNKVMSVINKNNCTGSYQVSGYTRSDGTRVDSYVRNCYIHGR